MRQTKPTHLMRTSPADREWLTRREADSFPLTVFERSFEPADDDDEDDADTEADDEDGDEDDADTDEHEHGGEA